jgi:hypothetical protein
LRRNDLKRKFRVGIFPKTDVMGTQSCHFAVGGGEFARGRVFLR